MRGRALLLLATLLSTGVSAATVRNGASLSVDGTTYVLWGIEAPALAQTCARDWPAGQEAARALEDLIRDKDVVCDLRDKDRAGRQTALCRADGVDLAEAMVKSGMAWAKLGVTRGYIQQEARAAAGYLGVHGRRCQQPEAWRAKHASPEFQRDESGASGATNETD